MKFEIALTLALNAMDAEALDEGHYVYSFNSMNKIRESPAHTTPASATATVPLVPPGAASPPRRLHYAPLRQHNLLS